MIQKKRLIKTVITLAIVIIMALSVVALVACDLDGNSGYQRHPNSPSNINAQLENQIRQTYLEKQGAGVAFSDVYVSRYFGTFGETSVVQMHIAGGGVGDSEWTETVAGVTFWQSSWIPIRAWRSDNFYTLTQAHSSDFLSIANLNVIADQLGNPPNGGEQVEDYQLALENFDLNGSTDFWSGEVNEKFEDDRVVVTMRKSTTFPNLGLGAFNISNAESLEYIWLRPTPQQVSQGNFRQVVIIRLEEHGRSRVAGAIKELEKLGFVQRAEPLEIEPKDVNRVPNVDEDFDDNKIVVVLRRRFSIPNNEINAKHFHDALSATEIVSIVDMTYFTSQIVIDNMLNTGGSFAQILKITLNTNCKENVLRVAGALEQLTIVHAAEPNFNFSVEPG